MSFDHYFEGDEATYLENNKGIIHDALQHAFRCLKRNLDQLQLDEEGHCKDISTTSGCEYKIFWPREFKQIRNMRGISDDEIIDELRGELQGPYRSSAPAALKQLARSPRPRGLLSVKSNFSLLPSAAPRPPASAASSPTTTSMPTLFERAMGANSPSKDASASVLPPAPPPATSSDPTAPAPILLPPAPPSVSQSASSAAAPLAPLTLSSLTTESTATSTSSTLVDELPKNALFSAGKKLIFRIISHNNKQALQSFIQEYAEYMTLNPKSYLFQIFGLIRICVRGSRSKISLMNLNDYVYVLVERQVYPRLSHTVMDVFFLNGNKRDAVAHARDYKSDADFKLDHELAMKVPERKEVLKQLEMDVDFLKSMNLCNYSLCYAMTERLRGHENKLPGAEYGPDPDYGISIEHKPTLRIRHDLPYGVAGPAAQLIPIPHTNYENPNR